jgi:hypothetical protein
MPPAKAPRAGSTAKVSVSIERADLALLQRRARKLYGGNLSAAVGEGVRHIREQEGREALVAWLGSAGEASDAERDQLRREWQAPAPPTQARRKRS